MEKVLLQHIWRFISPTSLIVRLIGGQWPTKEKKIHVAFNDMEMNVESVLCLYRLAMISLNKRVSIEDIKFYCKHF